MGTVLEFYVQMKDMMSSGLANLAKNSKSTFSKIQSDVNSTSANLKNKFTTAFNGASDRSKYFGHSLDELKIKLKEVNAVKFGTVLKSEFKTASAEAERLSKQINKMEGRSSKGSIIGKLMPYIGAAAIASAAIGFSKQSVAAAMDFSKVKTTFGVLTGSKATGNELAGDLRGLKQDTVMGPAVYKNAQTMLAFGINSKDIVKDLRMLGDVSMGDANRLQHLTLAFSEVQAQGKLTGKEVRQMSLQGFNPLKEMSVMTGKSMEKLREEMKAGSISAEMVGKAYAHATGPLGRFHGMLEKIGETTAGRMQKLKGQWLNLKIEAGEALMPIVDQTLQWGSSLLKVLNIHKDLSQTLSIEKGEMNAYVSAITDMNEGSVIRKQLLSDLIAKYPEWFGQLDIEKVKNQDLLNILEKVNGAYEDRIKIATSKEMEKTLKTGATEALNKSIHFGAAAAFMKKGQKNQAGDQLSFMEKMEAGLHGFDLKGLSMKYKKQYDDLSGKAGLQAGETALAEKEQLINRAKELKTSNYLVKVQKVLKSQKEITAFFDETTNAGALMGNANGSEGDPNHEALMQKYKMYDATKLKGWVDKIDAAGIKSGKGSNQATVNSESDKASRSIASGGPRIININGVKFMDKLELHTATFGEGKEQIEAALEEMYLRLLNSGASIQN